MSPYEGASGPFFSNLRVERLGLEAGTNARHCGTTLSDTPRSNCPRFVYTTRNYSNPDRKHSTTTKIARQR